MGGLDLAATGPAGPPPAYGTGSIRCEGCSEIVQVLYKAGKISQRGPCPCSVTPERWKAEVDKRQAEQDARAAEERARAEELERRREQARVDAEQAEQRAADRAVATECWDLSGQQCRRHSSNLFDVCYACPRGLS